MCMALSLYMGEKGHISNIYNMHLQSASEKH